MLLTSTSDKIELVTSAAVPVDVHTSFMDYNGTTVTPGRLNTAISTAATTDVSGSPGASIQRNIKLLTVRNKHASTAVDVTVRHNDGTTTVEMTKGTLKAGEELQYTPTLGFLWL